MLLGSFFLLCHFLWLPCLLAAEFFLLYSSWIIKKCCDSQYDCESGAAALNCAVTFACFSHSSLCSPCLFSCSLARFTCRSMMLQSSRPKSHLERGREGGILRWWILKKSCLPSSTERALFVWICIQVRVLFTGEGRGEGGIFFFPIMHQQQDPNWHRGLGSFSRDKHPVSCLTPSKGNLPGTSFHRNTHTPVVFSNKTKDPWDQHTRPSPRSWPATVASDPTSSVFSRSFRFPWLPSLTCQWLSGTAETTVAALRKGYENSCWQMKNSCSVTIYLSIPASSSLSLPPLFLDDAQMTHQSVQHMGLGLFCLWSVGEY